MVQVCYLSSTLSFACLFFMVRPTESTKRLLDNYRMPLARDSWSTRVAELSKDFQNLVGCVPQTPSTSDARKILNNDWSQDDHSEIEPTIDSEEFPNDWCSYDYLSEMEPTNSQEMMGVETTSRARISEGIGVVKARGCMLEELPPEIMGLILANVDQGSIANFRLASRQCACYGLEYLFTKGKVQFNLCHDLGYGMNILTRKNVSWRIKNLELYGDVKEQLFGDCRNPGHLHFHDGPVFGESVHMLNNLKSLELEIERRLEIPLYIHLAASWLMSFFLLHILIVHRSPIMNLSIVNVGWWIPYGEGTKPAKAISTFEKFELLGDLDRLDHYGDILPYLQSMTGLKKLVIDFGMTSVIAPWDMSYICEMKFDRLRSVCFSNVYASKDKLLQFFENHNRLQDIRIGTMLLLDGSWPRTIHAMAEILRDLRTIKFSGLQSFTRGEEVYEGGYICSTSLNAYVKQFAWKVVRLDRQARERRVTVEMLGQERSARKMKAAAGNLGARDVCGTCGFLMEFCTRLT